MRCAEPGRGLGGGVGYFVGFGRATEPSNSLDARSLGDRSGASVEACLSACAQKQVSSCAKLPSPVKQRTYQERLLHHLLDVNRDPALVRIYQARDQLREDGPPELDSRALPARCTVSRH